MPALFTTQRVAAADQHALDISSAAVSKCSSRAIKVAVLIFCVAASFALTIVVPFVTRIEPKIFRVFAATQPVYLLLAAAVAAIVGCLLLRHAEIAVAIFYVIGFFKGDARLESSPLDLTVSVAVLMILAMLIRLAFTETELKLPRVLLRYVPFLFLMFLLLSFTPSLAAGLDKTLRFVFLTLLAPLSPFILVNSRLKLEGFLAPLLIAAILM